MSTKITKKQRKTKKTIKLSTKRAPALQKRAARLSKALAGNSTKRIPMPTQMATVTRNRGPNRGKGVVLTNHQNILDVNSSATVYQVASIVIQPGDAKVFPWLSKMAVNYETYKFTELVATYNPLVGTGVSGRVAMYWEYDVFDAPPTDYTTATAQPGFTSTSPFFSVSTKLDIRKAYLQTPVKYVKADGQIDRLNDTAKLVVIVLSQAGAEPQLLGQISLRYTVSLQTPSADGPNLVSNGEALFETKSDRQLTGTPVILPADLASTYNTIGPQVATTTPTGLVKLPSGQYKLSASHTLSTPYVNTAAGAQAKWDHGFFYNAIDSLSGGSFDKCNTSVHAAPAALGSQTAITHPTNFECFVDLAVDTFVGARSSPVDYNNIGVTSVVEGATLAVQRVARSLAAAIFGGGGYTATLAPITSTSYPPMPSPENPNWPPIPALRPARGVYDAKTEIRKTMAMFENTRTGTDINTCNLQALLCSPETATKPSQSYILSLGRPLGPQELVLNQRAVSRLIREGHPLPFDESLVDTVPEDDWVLAEA